MKTKKITLIALSLIVLVAIAGCTPSNTGYNTRLGTQTRIGGMNTPSGNGAMPDNTMGNRNLVGQGTMLNRNNAFGLNDGWNNGLYGGYNNGLNTGLNTRFNTGLNTGLYDGYNTGLNNTGFNNTGFNNTGLSNTGLNTNTNLSTSLGNVNTNASELARRIGTLPEVASATCATSNNKAVVGLKLRNNQALGASLRQRIETMVRDTNRNITNVSITTDPSLFTRIQNLSSGATTGHPTQNINTEVEDLIRRITPNTTHITR